MSDLDITIALDPGPAAAASKKVADGMREAEAVAKKAEAAYTSMGETFARVGRLQAMEADRARAAVSSFGEQLARIGRMQALDARATQQALAEKSAAYASFGEQLARVARYQQMLNEQAAKTISLPTPQVQGGGFGSQLMDQVKGGLSPGNIASGVVGGLVGGGLGSLAISGITDMIDDWREHSKAVDDAEKMLRKYYESAGRTSDVVERLDGQARLLNVSVRDQAAAFASVREASDGLHLTTLELTQATTTLTEIMKLNGKSAADVGPLMEQLQLAMNTGVLTGGQFTTLLKQYPDLINAWAASMGMSTKELKGLAEGGKVGQDELGKLFATLIDGREVHRKYDETNREFALAMEESAAASRKAAEGGNAASKMVDNLSASIAGSLAHIDGARESTATWADAMEKLASSIEIVNDHLHRIDRRNFFEGINAARDLAGKAWSATNRLFNDPWGDSPLTRGLKAIHADAKQATDEFTNLHGILVKIANEDYRNLAVARTEGVPSAIPAGWKPTIDPAMVKIGGVDRDMAKFREGAAMAHGEYEQKLYEDQRAAIDRITGSQEKYNRELGIAKAAFADGAITASQYATEVRRINDAYDKTSDFTKALDELGRSSIESLKSAAHSLGDAFVDAFTRADFSASEFFKTLGVGLLKQGIGALMNFGFGAAGIGGGATGFDSIVGQGRGAFLPGFATGGDMLALGGGGTDSRIAAFRVTPGESIHVRTPQQRAEASASMAPRTVQINIPGETGAITEHNIEGLIVRIVEQRSPAIRRRLGVG